MKHYRHFIAWWVCIGAGLMMTSQAPGQYALGDGRALDNNLQVGSGGYNQRAIVPDYQARNNLVTGNIAGLGYFRDDVGYNAPGAFGDVLSTDALYRFRARSYSPQPRDPQTGRRMRRAAESQSIYRFYTPPQPGVPGDRLINQRIDANETGAYRAFDFNRGARQSPGGVSDRFTQTMTLLPQPDGRILEVTASPLLGVRQQLHDPRKGLGLYEQLSSGEASSELESDESLINKPQNAIDSLPWYSDASEQLRTIARPGLDLGAQLDRRLAAPVIADHPALEQLVARIESQMFGLLGTKNFEPGDDVYLQLLQQIRNPSQEAGMAGEEAQATDTQPASVLAEENPADPLDSDAPELELAQPTPVQVRDALAERIDAMRTALGMDPLHEADAPGRTGHLSDQSPEDKVEDDPASLSTQIQALRKQAELFGVGPGMDEYAQTSEGAKDPVDVRFEQERRRLEDLLETLDHDLPSLQTLADRKNIRINRLLRQGEEQLAQGRYFDAEQNYRLVLIGVPRHPMARVGMIHCQLGAGMIRSASYNLRTLFEQHPELIATRYDARLLPNAKRLQWARGEIEKILNRSTQPEPALLLAYLGYQIHNALLTSWALDLADARSPLDPLVVLLRRIWLDVNEKPKPPPPSPAQDEAPSEPVK